DVDGGLRIALRIHGAAAGANGPIVRNLTVRDNGDGTADFQGEFTLTAGEITALEAGEFYINVHTVDNGGGELRGQFPAVADFDTLTGPVDSGAFEEVQNLTAQVTDIVTAQDAIIAGEAEVFLNGNRADVRTQETNFGNLTADANLAAAQAIDPTVLVSLKNGGGIRAAIGQQGDGVPEPTITEANPLSGKQAGEISALDIDNSLRFDNGLVTLDLTPEQLKIVLEHAVAATEDGATPGQFGQVGGLAFSFDPTQTAQVLGAGGVPTTEGERVQTITLIDANGNPTTEIFRDGAFNPDAPATIRVVTLDFLALFGGDGYPYGDFGVPITDLGIGEQQALVDFLSTNFSGGAAVIASDLTSGASVGLNSFTNDFAGAFSSAGDGFETYQRGVSGSFPFAVTDDSAGNFPTDDVGIVQTPDVDPFFGIVDTENDDNTGPVTATWAFDIAGETGLSVEIDFAAMGDFETSDIVSITASIDGGAAETLFDLVADEDGSLTYTLESGTQETLDDPMTIDGTVLNNVFQTFSADVTGTGNELTLTLTAVTNGGDEAVALRNIEVIAGGAAFDDPDTPISQDTRIVNLAEQTDILDAPETTGDFTFNRVFQFNGGGAEVVAHEAGRLYVTNDGGGRIDVIDAATGTALVPIDVSTLDGFDGIQSVDVAGGIVAVAVKRAPAEQSFLGDTFDISQPGFVAFYDAAAGTLLSTVDVGNLPDDVTFSPDGSILMVAGEGEFNDDSDNDDDPLGVVSIVTVGDGTAPTVQTADFIKFAGLEEELREAGARIKASASAPFDFEPEYVAFAPDGATAYVTLQENNAVAVIDVATATVTDIIGLGTRDFATPGNGLDPLDDGNINIRTFDSDILVGWRMPDALEVFEVDGETFFVTANEGDSRDFDEERVEDLVDDGLLDEALEQRLRDQGLIDDDGDTDVGLERLEVSSVDGDTDGDGDIDVIHAFSTRGITIFDDDGAVVFDSGDLAEAFLAANFPDRFNDDDGDDGEDRSDAKGPEFEGVGVGEVDGELLLFALAERDSGVFVFNVSDPANPTFVNYIDGFAGSDQSPEVVEFISAADSTSGFAQIAVAYEVSGTVSLFDILPGGATVGSIQGAGHISPFEGQVVTTSGIVTAVDSDGFYLQDPTGDGDDATSDAIFVETGSAPTVVVGDEAEV
ncbi:MAG: choice-of-anchor I family protein, partial [Planctomycetota bacterium]